MSYTPCTCEACLARSAELSPLAGLRADTEDAAPGFLDRLRSAIGDTFHAMTHPFSTQRTAK